MDKLSGHALDPLVVVHEDSQVLVIDKPAGLLCVPGRGADKQDCLSARVQRQYPGALVVHRLDQATSGLCVFARGIETQRALGRQFEARAVTKLYVACVAGRMELPQGEWGSIDLPIAADWPRRPLRVVDASGKPSHTLWRPLAFDAGPDTTRVELKPVTGRTHQLRVHLQALGHPILGDTLYAPPAVQTLAPRLLLHACELAFVDPANGQQRVFKSALPF